MFAVVEGGIAIYIFLIFHCACFQGGIIAIMVSNGVGILYIPYILMFLLIQYVVRIKKYSIEERQMVESIAGLRRYIKDYSLLNEKDSLEYIALWEDYFILAIALELNYNTINYFYNYGKEQNSIIINILQEYQVLLVEEVVTQVQVEVFREVVLQEAEEAGGGGGGRF